MKKNKSRKVEISAIVLVGGKLDQKLFKKCLNSIAWCKEIIKIETGKLNGNFSDWRNFGAQKAGGDWLLYVDTDEEISDSLKNEIVDVVGKGSCSAYAIPRKNILLGHEMKHGGWAPDYVLRLIKKADFRGWLGYLHEQPLIEGNVGKLNNKLIHRSHRNLSDMTEKTNSWSVIEAELMYGANHPDMNIFRFASAAFREFWYRCIKKGGYLDGSVGVVEIIYQTYSKLISYMKLWEMQKSGVNGSDLKIDK